MTSINQPTNHQLTDANITPSNPPTDPPTPPPTKKGGRKTSQQKDAELKEKDATIKDMMKRMKEMEVNMRAMVKDKEEWMAKKPTRKPREPKPIIYWEGQVETEGGWKFDSLANAMNYAKTLKGDETLLFVADWGQSFAEKKEKTADKRGPRRMEPKEAMDSCDRCEVNIWTADGRTGRCPTRKFCMRGDRNICKRHNTDADKHMLKYEGWTIEDGHHYGWWDDESSHQKFKQHNIRKDFVPQSRRKKV